MCILYATKITYTNNFNIKKEKVSLLIFHFVIVLFLK